MHVCLGGTFEYIHEGHISLLKKAFEIGDEVTIGITDDMLIQKLGKRAKSFGERKKNLEKFLENREWRKKAIIVPLSDIYGPAAHDDFDAIVVSPETFERAKKINEIRREKNLNELEIIKIPFVMAEDGIPISSSRIKSGEIKNGRRIKPLIIKIGSTNEVKIEATKKAFQKFFSHLEMRFESIEAGTTPQPFNQEIMDGAIYRAKKAISTSDYGVGIEAGVKEEEGIYMVEQYCAIVDKTGYTTWGKSPAFECPDWILAEIKEKEMREIIPFKKGEEEKGAVGYLSKGIITREHITEEAVTMALLPRIKQC